jgi:hypothetical protein
VGVSSLRADSAANVEITYLLPEPQTPQWGDAPVPTLLLVGGLAAGLLLALVSRLLARLGAARRRRAARRRLLEQVRRVADELVCKPVQEELDAHDRLCAALARIA